MRRSLWLLALGVPFIGTLANTAVPGSRFLATEPDSVPFSYEVGAVRVIQRINAANDAVAVNIYLLGGARQLTPATQGIEALYLAAAELGTREHAGTASRERWSETGSRSFRESTWDWSVIGFRGLRQDFDSSWNILAARIAHPTLRATDVALARDRLISAIRMQRESPDGELHLLADSIAFAGSLYALRPEGTEGSLRSMDSATVAAYVSSQVVQSRLLVVVVGNVTRGDVEQAVRRVFGSLPKGSYTWTPQVAAAQTTASLTLFSRPFETNYLIGVFDGPERGSEDYEAFNLATSLLGGAIGGIVRGAEGLSYVATAGVRARARASGELYVTTTKPDTVVALIRRVIERVKSMGVGTFYTAALSEAKVQERWYRSQTNGLIADALAEAHILRGDFRLATAAAHVRDLSSGTTRTAANKYFKNFHFVYLGDTTVVRRETFTKIEKP